MFWPINWRKNSILDTDAVNTLLALRTQPVAATPTNGL